jgi:D-glycero-alpha-D-manno-heptose-7-phosphate kinase
MSINTNPEMNETQTPIRIIRSRTPVRICDNGGWTDTWFAGHGAVFNIAVKPGIEIEMKIYPRAGKHWQAAVHSNHFGDLVLPYNGTKKDPRFDLLEAIITSAKIPDDISVEIYIRSDVPPGSATGTSATAAVALLGAFEMLFRREVRKQEVAYKAHDVETRLLGQQSGIQDQLCASYGGVNFIEIPGYPNAVVHQLNLSERVLHDLGERLVLIYLGTAHSSSAIHENVIRELQSAGPECEQLQALRRAAIDSRDAVLAGNMEKLGIAMRNNTEAQGRLHPALVSVEARKIIAIAEQYGALGWKVNGAGGEGGSLTLLAGERKSEMIHAIETADARVKNIPLMIDPEGLAVSEVEQ